MVHNPGFENHTSCPGLSGEIDRADGWSSFSGTVDYMNSCAAPGYFCVPGNWAGYQPPAGGNAYAACVTYYEAQPNYREYAGSLLNTPLIAGHRYFISFKASLSLGALISGVYATTIGVKFLNYEPHPPVPPPLLSPLTDNRDAVHSAVVTDTAGWTTVFGSFVADSAYRYIAIGNFFDDAHTSRTKLISYGNSAYYYIDDICVSKDSAYAATYGNETTAGIGEDHILSFSVYPNPVSDRLTVSRETATPYTLSVCNALGQAVYTKEAAGNQEIDVSGFPGGIYFICIRTEKGMSAQKIVVGN